MTFIMFTYGRDNKKDKSKGKSDNNNTNTIYTAALATI